MMLPVKSWTVFYADESRFTSTMGTWAEAPPFGVEAVVYYHTEGKTIHLEPNDESRYFYLGEDELEGHKLGLWMDSAGYYRILEMVKAST